MELEDIIQELDRRFDLPLREYYERRIIFWQDPEGEFREEIAGVKLQHAKVLVLTTFDLDEYVYSALQAGASGFLLKDAGPDLLEKISALVAASPGSSLVRTGKPRTTLERLFLREIREEEEEP